MDEKVVFKGGEEEGGNNTYTLLFEFKKKKIRVSVPKHVGQHILTVIGASTNITIPESVIHNEESS